MEGSRDGAWRRPRARDDPCGLAGHGEDDESQQTIYCTHNFPSIKIHSNLYQRLSIISPSTSRKRMCSVLNRQIECTPSRPPTSVSLHRWLLILTEHLTIYFLTPSHRAPRDLPDTPHESGTHVLYERSSVQPACYLSSYQPSARSYV